MGADIAHTMLDLWPLAFVLLGGAALLWDEIDLNKTVDR
jgi:hypothetical protein